MLMDSISQHQFHQGSCSGVGCGGEELDLDYIGERQALLKQREVLQQQWLEQLEFAQRRIEQMETKLAYNARQYTTDTTAATTNNSKSQQQLSSCIPQSSISFSPLSKELKLRSNLQEQEQEQEQEDSFSYNCQSLSSSSYQYSSQEEENEDVDEYQVDPLEEQEQQQQQQQHQSSMVIPHLQFLCIVLGHFFKIFFGFTAIFAVVFSFVYSCCNVTIPQVLFVTALLPLVYLYRNPGKNLD